MEALKIVLVILGMAAILYALLLVCTMYVSEPFQASDGHVESMVPMGPLPPNLYTTPNRVYSNQDIAALIEKLRSELVQSQTQTQALLQSRGTECKTASPYRA